ncbi:hypothetical protein GGX14DRAFT_405161 [Mycena pura]|uniref:Uncharacterized protein n=1 Tax=Mycena pura TaxID=153505 RepID=A0AAD6XZG6_9AGAR|nr:hypothetical protein GGX14DRAFT_405161 [Mycena pura]
MHPPHPGAHIKEVEGVGIDTTSPLTNWQVAQLHPRISSACHPLCEATAATRVLDLKARDFCRLLGTAAPQDQTFFFSFFLRAEPTEGEQESSSRCSCSRSGSQSLCPVAAAGRTSAAQPTGCLYTTTCASRLQLAQRRKVETQSRAGVVGDPSRNGGGTGINRLLAVGAASATLGATFGAVTVGLHSTRPLELELRSYRSQTYASKDPAPIRRSPSTATPAASTAESIGFPMISRNTRWHHIKHAYAGPAIAGPGEQREDTARDATWTLSNNPKQRSVNRKR